MPSFLVLAGSALVGALFAGTAPPLIEVVEPAEGQPLFDDVEIIAEVRPGDPRDPVNSVDIVVDGVLLARLPRPPYRLTHDFGGENVGHEILVRARTVSGAVSSVRLAVPPIREDEVVDLELQQLYVTATDRHDGRVLNLRRDEFRISDDGVSQEIVTFQIGDVPFTAVLLVDASDSMHGQRLDAALRGARRFIAGMRPLDEAKLVLFSDRLLTATPFGAGGELSQAPQTEVRAVGSTAIRDHLFLALSVLEERQGRRVLLLLTDGWDHASFLSSGHLRSAIERSQSQIYWVRLRGDEPTDVRELTGRVLGGDQFVAMRFHPAMTSWTDTRGAVGGYRDLEEVVALTGGRVLTASAVADLEQSIQDVLTELREQYAVGYYPRPRGRPGKWRDIEVELLRRSVSARTRKGYVDR